MDTIESVAALVRLNGNQVIGKTRFQKIAYLLEAIGVGLDLSFDYHNYGPFSAELAISLDDARDLGLISMEDKPGYHAVPYTVFKATDSTPSFDDGEEAEKRRQALEKMAPYDALVLELAATAEYLRRNGYPDNAWEEVEKRKPLKATSDRTEKAKALLRQLGLPS